MGWKGEVVGNVEWGIGKGEVGWKDEVVRNVALGRVRWKG